MIRGISVHTPRQDSPAESHKKFDVGDERRTVLQPASFDVSMSRVEHLQTETENASFPAMMSIIHVAFHKTRANT